MMNFLFGTVAGGIIACVATIAAARHPDVQSRLGLIPSAQAALAPPPAAAPAAKTCPTAARPPGEASLASSEKLFEKRRFWFVAP